MGRPIGSTIGADIVGTDHCKGMVDVRFLPGLMILVLGLYGVSAFCEVIPTGQPPVP